eukprot:1731422-Rhodomonas_salina.1
MASQQVSGQLRYGPMHAPCDPPSSCLRSRYEKSGTDLAYGMVYLGSCYENSGTDLVYGAIYPRSCCEKPGTDGALGSCYDKSGTDLAYGATDGYNSDDSLA